MSKKDNVDKIKSYIEDILGAKGSLRSKLPAKKSKEKELFCEILQNLQFKSKIMTKYQSSLSNINLSLIFSIFPFSEEISNVS